MVVGLLFGADSWYAPGSTRTVPPTDDRIDGRLDGLLGIADAGATVGIVTAGRVDVAGGRAVGGGGGLELQVVDEEAVAGIGRDSRSAGAKEQRVDGMGVLVGGRLRIVPEVVLPAGAGVDDGTVDGDGDDVVAGAIDEVHVEAQRVRHRPVKTAGDLGRHEVGAARRRARTRLLDVNEVDGQPARLVLDAQVAHARAIAAIGRDGHRQTGLLSARDRGCDVEGGAEMILAGAAGEATIRRAGLASFVDEGLRERLVPEAAAGDAHSRCAGSWRRTRRRAPELVTICVVIARRAGAGGTGAAPAILAVDRTVRECVERDRRGRLSVGDTAEPERQ